MSSHFQTSNLVAFPPPEAETRPLIPTEQAAYYLMREQQTLRVWASQENGPIRPTRVGRRLGWPMADIRALLSQGG
jgi:hypothetical protein